MDFDDSLMRSLVALAIVVGLLMVLASVARRLLSGRLPAQAGPPLIRILDSSYVDPRKSIAVVAVAEELFVVGATADNLVLLGRIADREQIRRVLSQAPAIGASERAFGPWLPLRRVMMTLRVRVRAWCHNAEASPSEGVGEHGGC